MCVCVYVRVCVCVSAAYQPEELFTFTTTNARKAIRLTIDGSTASDGPRPVAEATEHTPTHTDTHDPLSYTHAGPVAEAGEETGTENRRASLSSPKTSVPIRHYGMKSTPTRDELGLLRGELNLALRLPGLSSKPLVSPCMCVRLCACS